MDRTYELILLILKSTKLSVGQSLPTYRANHCLSLCIWCGKHIACLRTCLGLTQIMFCHFGWPVLSFFCSLRQLENLVGCWIQLPGYVQPATPQQPKWRIPDLYIIRDFPSYKPPFTVTFQPATFVKLHQPVGRFGKLSSEPFISCRTSAREVSMFFSLLFASSEAMSCGVSNRRWSHGLYCPIWGHNWAEIPVVNGINYSIPLRAFGDLTQGSLRLN
jgi:hypothetical protein